METATLNTTLDCIKETTTITQRIITNVCTGDVTQIPIGFWEMVRMVGIAAIFALLMGILCYVLYLMIQEIISH